MKTSSDIDSGDIIDVVRRDGQKIRAFVHSNDGKQIGILPYPVPRKLGALIYNVQFLPLKTREFRYQKIRSMSKAEIQKLTPRARPKLPRSVRYV